MPRPSRLGSLGVLIAVLAVALGPFRVAAYNPGFSRASVATVGQDTLIAHDVHPTLYVTAVLASSSSAGGRCTALRPGPGGPAGCGGVDLVVNRIGRLGQNLGSFRVGTPGDDVGLGIAWSRTSARLFILGRTVSTGQHWLAVVLVGFPML